MTYTNWLTSLHLWNHFLQQFLLEAYCILGIENQIGKDQLRYILGCIWWSNISIKTKVIIIHKYLIISLYEQLQVNIVLPVLYLLICAFLVVLPLSTTPRLVGVAMVIICAGIPVYIVCIYWKGKPRWIRKLTREYYNTISGINNHLFLTLIFTNTS